ncbi:MAG: ATPase [Bacteroidales bacterium]|nr:ATPase [Bacteroidales bacterium]
MVIISDSGSTKTSWRLIKKNGSVASLQTAGINPVFMENEAIVSLLKDGLREAVGGEGVREVDFYGAGIVDEEIKGRLSFCFKAVFPGCAVHASSDMLAAARALCGHTAGIACILGTGSNCCFYDGENIAQSAKAGGFILGDEASGAYLGKRLISDYIKGLLPADLESEFNSRYGLDYPAIVRKVYKEPLPSRFLASFSPFINEFKETPYMANLLKESFSAFISRNLHHFDTGRYSVNFVGSIAYHYSGILKEAVISAGMKPGVILKEPIDGLVEYHKSL